MPYTPNLFKPLTNARVSALQGYLGTGYSVTQENDRLLIKNRALGQEAGIDVTELTRVRSPLGSVTGNKPYALGFGAVPELIKYPKLLGGTTERKYDPEHDRNIYSGRDPIERFAAIIRSSEDVVIADPRISFKSAINTVLNREIESEFSQGTLPIYYGASDEYLRNVGGRLSIKKSITNDPVSHEPRALLPNQMRRSREIFWQDWQTSTSRMGPYPFDEIRQMALSKDDDYFSMFAGSVDYLYRGNDRVNATATTNPKVINKSVQYGPQNQVSFFQKDNSRGTSLWKELVPEYNLGDNTSPLRYSTIGTVGESPSWGVTKRIVVGDVAESGGTLEYYNASLSNKFQYAGRQVAPSTAPLPIENFFDLLPGGPITVDPNLKVLGKRYRAGRQQIDAGKINIANKAYALSIPKGEWEMTGGSADQPSLYYLTVPKYVYNEGPQKGGVAQGPGPRIINTSGEIQNIQKGLGDHVRVVQGSSDQYQFGMFGVVGSGFSVRNEAIKGILSPVGEAFTVNSPSGRQEIIDFATGEVKDPIALGSGYAKTLSWRKHQNLMATWAQSQGNSDAARGVYNWFSKTFAPTQGQAPLVDYDAVAAKVNEAIGTNTTGTGLVTDILDKAIFSKQRDYAQNPGTMTPAEYQNLNRQWERKFGIWDMGEQDISYGPVNPVSWANKKENRVTQLMKEKNMTRASAEAEVNARFTTSPNPEGSQYLPVGHQKLEQAWSIPFQAQEMMNPQWGYTQGISISPEAALAMQGMSPWLSSVLGIQPGSEKNTTPLGRAKSTVAGWLGITQAMADNTMTSEGMPQNTTVPTQEQLYQLDTLGQDYAGKKISTREYLDSSSKVLGNSTNLITWDRAGGVPTPSWETIKEFGYQPFGAESEEIGHTEAAYASTQAALVKQSLDPAMQANTNTYARQRSGLSALDRFRSAMSKMSQKDAFNQQLPGVGGGIWAPGWLDPTGSALSREGVRAGLERVGVSNGKEMRQAMRQISGGLVGTILGRYPLKDYEHFVQGMLTDESQREKLIGPNRSKIVGGTLSLKGKIGFGEAALENMTGDKDVDPGFLVLAMRKVGGAFQAMTDRWFRMAKNDSPAMLAHLREMEKRAYPDENVRELINSSSQAPVGNIIDKVLRKVQTIPLPALSKAIERSIQSRENIGRDYNTFMRDLLAAGSFTGWMDRKDVTELARPNAMVYQRDLDTMMKEGSAGNPFVTAINSAYFNMKDDTTPILKFHGNEWSEFDSREPSTRGNTIGYYPGKEIKAESLLSGGVQEIEKQLAYYMTRQTDIDGNKVDPYTAEDIANVLGTSTAEKQTWMQELGGRARNTWNEHLKQRIDERVAGLAGDPSALEAKNKEIITASAGLKAVLAGPLRKSMSPTAFEGSAKAAKEFQKVLGPELSDRIMSIATTQKIYRGEDFHSQYARRAESLANSDSPAQRFIGNLMQRFSLKKWQPGEQLINPNPPADPAQTEMELKVEAVARGKVQPSFLNEFFHKDEQGLSELQNIMGTLGSMGAVNYVQEKTAASILGEEIHAAAGPKIADILRSQGYNAISEKLMEGTLPGQTEASRGRADVLGAKINPTTGKLDFVLPDIKSRKNFSVEKVQGQLSGLGDILKQQDWGGLQVGDVSLQAVLYDKVDASGNPLTAEQISTNIAAEYSAGTNIVNIPALSNQELEQRTNQRVLGRLAVKDVAVDIAMKAAKLGAPVDINAIRAGLVRQSKGLTISPTVGGNQGMQMGTTVSTLPPLATPATTQAASSGGQPPIITPPVTPATPAPTPGNKPKAVAPSNVLGTTSVSGTTATNSKDNIELYDEGGDNITGYIQKSGVADAVERGVKQAGGIGGSSQYPAKSDFEKKQIYEEGYKAYLQFKTRKDYVKSSLEEQMLYAGIDPKIGSFETRLDMFSQTENAQRVMAGPLGEEIRGYSKYISAMNKAQRLGTQGNVIPDEVMKEIKAYTDIGPGTGEAAAISSFASVGTASANKEDIKLAKVAEKTIQRMSSSLDALKPGMKDENRGLVDQYKEQEDIVRRLTNELKSLNSTSGDYIKKEKELNDARKESSSILGDLASKEPSAVKQIESATKDISKVKDIQARILSQNATPEDMAFLDKESTGGNLGTLGRELFGGFGLMYMRSVGNIMMQGMGGAGYSERSALSAAMTQTQNRAGGFGASTNMANYYQNMMALTGAGYNPQEAMAMIGASNPILRQIGNTTMAGLGGLAATMWGANMAKAANYAGLASGMTAMAPLIGGIVAGGSFIAGAAAGSKDVTSLAYQSAVAMQEQGGVFNMRAAFSNPSATASIGWNQFLRFFGNDQASKRLDAIVAGSYTNQDIMTALNGREEATILNPYRAQGIFGKESQPLSVTVPAIQAVGLANIYNQYPSITRAQVSSVVSQDIMAKNPFVSQAGAAEAGPYIAYNNVAFGGAGGGTQGPLTKADTIRERLATAYGAGVDVPGMWAQMDIAFGMSPTAVLGRNGIAASDAAAYLGGREGFSQQEQQLYQMGASVIGSAPGAAWQRPTSRWQRLKQAEAAASFANQPERLGFFNQGNALNNQLAAQFGIDNGFLSATAVSSITAGWDRQQFSIASIQQQMQMTRANEIYTGNPIQWGNIAQNILPKLGVDLGSMPTMKTKWGTELSSAYAGYTGMDMYGVMTGGAPGRFSMAFPGIGNPLQIGIGVPGTQQDLLNWQQAAGTWSVFGDKTGMSASLFQAVGPAGLMEGTTDASRSAFYQKNYGSYGAGYIGAMQNGVKLANGQLVGGQIGGEQWYANQQFGLQMASIGVGFKQIALQSAFTTGVGISAYAGAINPQTGSPFNFNTGKFSWNVQGVGGYTSQGGGEWGLADAQRYLGYAQQEYGFGMQQRQMNLQSKQFGENMGLQWRGMQLSREQGTYEYQYATGMAQQQFGFSQTMFREQARFTSGRERRIAEMENRQAVTVYNAETANREKEFGFQKQAWRLQEDQYRLQIKQFNETKRLQQEQLDMSIRFYQENKKLQEQAILMSRAQWTEQIKLQKESLGIQAAQAILAKQVGDAQRVEAANAELLKTGIDGLNEDSFPTLLANIALVAPAFKEMVKQMLEAVGGTYTDPGGEPGPGGACFIAGTMITMLDGTQKPIEKVEIGDWVLSMNTETKTIVGAKIIETIVHKPEEITGYIMLNDSIGVTPEHLIFNNGIWSSASEMKLGDRLINANGKVVFVQKLKWIPVQQVTYNLHTNHNSHNYFANGVLVHNLKKATGGIIPAGDWAVTGDISGARSGFEELVHALPGGGAAIYSNTQSKGKLDAIIGQKMMKMGGGSSRSIAQPINIYVGTEKLASMVIDIVKQDLAN